MFDAQQIALFLQNTLSMGDMRKQIRLYKHGYDMMETKIRSSLSVTCADISKIE